MTDLRVKDNDKDEITVISGDTEIRGWSYADERERRIKIFAAREFVEGWYQGDGRPELAEICQELGCTTKPGVALRFAKEMRRDLGRAHQRHAELIQTWDEASPTERQELDRLRRGWGPSTPTERMARREDLKAAMRGSSGRQGRRRADAGAFPSGIRRIVEGAFGNHRPFAGIA